MRAVSLSLAALSLLVIPTLAHATPATGDTIDVSYAVNIGGTMYPDSLGSFTSGSTGSTSADGLHFTYTLTGTQLTITEVAGDGNSFANLAFNGLVFTDANVSDLGLTGITLDPSSTVPGISAADASFSGNTISVNLAGLNVGSTYPGAGHGDYTPVGETAVFDLQSPSPAPTPEPSSLVLLGTGALAAAGTLRRRIFRA